MRLNNSRIIHNMVEANSLRWPQFRPNILRLQRRKAIFFSSGMIEKSSNLFGEKWSVVQLKILNYKTKVCGEHFAQASRKYKVHFATFPKSAQNFGVLTGTLYAYVTKVYYAYQFEAEFALQSLFCQEIRRKMPHNQHGCDRSNRKFFPPKDLDHMIGEKARDGEGHMELLKVRKMHFLKG